MPTNDGGPDGEEVVVTEALRSLRKSALCCRRARLMIEQTQARCATPAAALTTTGS
jgi:hypothetical protein